MMVMVVWGACQLGLCAGDRDDRFVDGPFSELDAWSQSSTAAGTSRCRLLDVADYRFVNDDDNDDTKAIAYKTESRTGRISPSFVSSSLAHSFSHSVCLAIAVVVVMRLRLTFIWHVTHSVCMRVAMPAIELGSLVKLVAEGVFFKSLFF